MGALILLPATEAAAMDACCYETCLRYCQPEHGFDWCHKFCNAECDNC